MVIPIDCMEELVGILQIERKVWILEKTVELGDGDGDRESDTDAEGDGGDE